MQLYKRGKIFWVRFTVQGIQRRESTKEVTKTAAGARALEIIQAFKEQGKKPARQISPLLSEFMLGWFTEWTRSSSSLSMKTREYYEYGISLLKHQPVTSMRISTIAEEDIDMINIGHSPSTHNCALRTLRRVLKLAVRRGLIDQAPRVRLLDENRRTSLIEPDIESRIANVIEGEGSRQGSLKTALYIMLDTGARPREIVHMKIEDVNFERGFIYVPKSKTKAGCRYLPITDRVKSKLFAQIGARSAGWVFPSPRRGGMPINSASLTAAWRTACKKSGVSPDIKLYCARHTFGTDAMKATKNPFLVMKAMGHTDLKTTERYQHHEIVELGSHMNERNARRAHGLVN